LRRLPLGAGGTVVASRPALAAFPSPLGLVVRPIVVLHVRDSLNLGHECPVGGGRCFQRLALADAVLNAHQAGEELFRRILFDVSVVYAYKGRDGARGSPPRLGHDGRRRSDDMVGRL